jgi:hypothetical protein
LVLNGCAVNDPRRSIKPLKSQFTQKSTQT